MSLGAAGGSGSDAFCSLRTAAHKQITYSRENCPTITITATSTSF